MRVQRRKSTRPLALRIFFYIFSASCLADSEFFEIMKNIKSLVIELIISSFCFRLAYGLDREMTIVVNAKEKECFYENVPQNFIIDIEYQV